VVGFGLLEPLVVTSCIAVLVSVNSLSLIHLVHLVSVLRKGDKILLDYPLMEMAKYVVFGS
jgi:hypothetical protein